MLVVVRMTKITAWSDGNQTGRSVGPEPSFYIHVPDHISGTGGQPRKSFIYVLPMYCRSLMPISLVK